MTFSTHTISPLRQRMIDDMRMRKLSPKTQSSYIRVVKRFVGFLGRSPDTASVEDLRRYQLHWDDHGISPILMNATPHTGLKFLFETTLDHSELLAKMHAVHVPHKLPGVLSREEVARLLAAVDNLKHQTALAVAYGAGLRASEVASLKVSGIDSQRMTLRIEQGKGSKDRYQSLSLDGKRWVSCKPGFFLSVRVLSRLFRRRFLEALSTAQAAGQLQFFGEYANLVDASAFADWLAPLKKCEWVVYAKRPFAGPEAVLAYLSRYTHWVAIANSRLVALDVRGITFRWKNYRAKGKTRHKTMTLTTGEFMRRFLLHVLPSGFHRIRHYGLLANGGRRDHLVQMCELLNVELLNVTLAHMESKDAIADAADKAAQPTFVCPDCRAAMIIVEILARKPLIRAPPPRGGAP